MVRVAELYVSGIGYRSNKNGATFRGVSFLNCLNSIPHYFIPVYFPSDSEISYASNKKCRNDKSNIKYTGVFNIIKILLCMVYCTVIKLYQVSIVILLTAKTTSNCHIANFCSFSDYCIKQTGFVRRHETLFFGAVPTGRAWFATG